jgi:hypothetical protein
MTRAGKISTQEGRRLESRNRNEFSIHAMKGRRIRKYRNPATPHRISERCFRERLRRLGTPSRFLGTLFIVHLRCGKRPATLRAQGRQRPRSLLSAVVSEGHLVGRATSIGKIKPLPESGEELARWLGLA